MEETRTASWRGPLLLLATVGAAVVLWFAVSAAVASGDSGGSDRSGGVGNDSSGPSWILPAQDGEAPDENDGRRGRDCPEKDRGGGEGGSGSGSNPASESV
jgi:hypothetical protein